MVKRKLINVFLILTLLLVVNNIDVYAAELTITPENVSTYNKGGNIRIPITISNNPGVCSLGFDVKYDSSAMTLLSVENGNIFELSDMTEGDFEKNPYTISYERLSNVSNDGILIYLNFKIKDTAANGKYNIELSQGRGGASNIDEAEFDVVYNTSSVSVISTGNNPYPFGDVDMDGTISAADAAIIMQKALVSTYKMPIEIAAEQGKL